ncbi:MAG TPA: PAS domain S-box protein [Methanoregulaceae archaeon]|nr:PAS domain S-box protein [Methanoregulaceae archaeon]
MADFIAATGHAKKEEPFHVLVVEDDRTRVELIGEVFSQHADEFRLTIARTLQEGMSAAGDDQPDLIFASLRLFDGDGLDILTKIDGLATVPLVLVAGDEDSQRVEEAAVKAGAFDYAVWSEGMVRDLPHYTRRTLDCWGYLESAERAWSSSLEAAERFRQISGSVGAAAIWSCDPEGTILSVNRAAADLAGGSPGDFTGRPVSELSGREKAGIILGRIQKAQKMIGAPDFYEDEIESPGGIHTMLSIYSPLRDAGGAVTGVQVISCDITEKKKAEETARESWKRLADILDILPDATFAIDMEGKVIAWNRAIEAMTGVSADQVLGKGEYEYSIPFYGERRPILIDLVLEREEDIEKRYLYMQRDGEKITSEAYIPGLFGGRGAYLWGTAAPLYDNTGNRAGAIEVIRDITERRKTEEALRRSEFLLNQTQEITHVGGWEYDIPSATITWTDEVYRIYEVPPDYDPNNIQADIAFYSPEDRAILEDAFRRAVEEGSPYDLELQFESRRGTKKWVKTTAQVEYAGGRPVRLVGNILDITARKEAEARIETLVAALSDEKEWLSSLLNSIPDEVWFTDKGHRFTLANPRAREEFSLGEEDTPVVEALAGNLEVYRPDGTPRPIDEAPPLRALAGEVITGMEEIIRTPATGQLRYRQVSSSPVRDVSGTITGAVTVVRDMTDVKEAEAKVRESNERFTLVAKATRDTIWDWDLVTDDHWWNEGIQAVFGYTPERVEPRITSWYDRIHPDDRDRVIGSIHAAIDEGENVWSEEYRFCRADGSYAQVLDRGYVIRNREGRAIRMVGALLDLSERIQMLNALRESEERYHNIIEDQTEFVCRFRPDGTYVYVNDAYARYFGKTPEELIGQVFFPGIFPQDREKVRQVFASLSPGSPVALTEHRIIMPDGTVRWQQWSDRAFFDDSGRVKEYQSVGRDITAQKEAEAALHESEERFRNLFLNMHAGVAIYEAVGNGEDFVIRDINPEVERIEKVKRDEVIGRSVLEVFPGIQEFGLFDVFSRVWKTGEPIEHPVSMYRDDRIVGWRDNFVYRLPSGEVVAIYEDVTVQKQAAEALSQSEERYRTLTESIPDIIARFDRERRHIFINSAIERITGLPVETFIGRTNQDLGMDEDLTGLWDGKLDQVFTQGKSLTFTFQYPARDGSLLFESRLIPEFSPDGTVLSVISVARDITAQHKAEEERRRSEARLEVAMKMGNIAWWEMDLPSGGVRFHDRKATMIGYAPDQFTTYQDFCSLLHPDDYEPAMKAMRDHLEGRRSRYDVEYRIRTSRGEWKWFHDSGGITASSPDGTTRTITGMVVDITAIKRAEENLRDAEKRYEEVVTHSPDSIFVVEVTDEGRFRMLYMNPVSEEEMGVSNESALGKFIGEIFSEDVSSHLASMYRKCLEEGSLLGYEETRELPEGRQYYSTTLVPLKDPSGRTARIIGISHNITSRRMMESEVRALNAVLEQRVAERTRELEETNVALLHEIGYREETEENLHKTLEEKLTLLREVHHRVKNNLQIIVSLLNLQARYITDEGTLAAIRESQNRVRAMALVHEKLYQTENLSRINLDDYIKFLGKNLFQFYGAASRGITFSTDLEEIFVDINTAIPFGLIMNELITNSLKYGFPGRKGGAVSVSVRRENNTLFVEYRDTGVGIPGDLDWRKPASLGLRLVNSLVSQLNGSIELDRSQGTAFSLVLQEKE